MIFCYTEFLFPRYSESDLMLLSSRPTVQSVQKNFLKKFSEKISQEYNCSSLKSKQYFRNKISVMPVCLIFSNVENFVCLFSFQRAPCTQPSASKNVAKTQCLSKLFQVQTKSLSKTLPEQLLSGALRIGAMSSCFRKAPCTLPSISKNSTDMQCLSKLLQVLEKSISKTFPKQLF